MTALAWFATGLCVGLFIGGALLVDEMVRRREAERRLQDAAPRRTPAIAHYSGPNSPHPKGHPCLYVEVPDELGEAWSAIGGPAA